MTVLRKIVDTIAWSTISGKMTSLLLLLIVGIPLCILVTGEELGRIELYNTLGAWAILGLIATWPLSRVLSYLIALRPIQELNGLCVGMQNGNFTPFEECPPEPSNQDELQKLRHNLFWMGHVIGRRQCELQTTTNKLEEAQRQNRSSLDYAEVIQKAFLPPADGFTDLFSDFFLLWEQRDGVGGDAYWRKETANGFFVAIIDCTGHGVPGAFMTLIVHSLLDGIDIQAYEKNPAGVLSAMNVAIKKAFHSDTKNERPDDGMDCTLLYVDNKRNSMFFAGARNYLFVRRPDGSIEDYKGDRKGVGNEHTPTDAVFTNHEIEIETGTRIYMLTDGLIDQIGEERRLPFGRKLFRNFIAQDYTSFEEQREQLRLLFIRYQGTEKRRDDLLVLGAEL
ncbi:MAG: PP2C family protein-serine/threonine phosphatase [Halodesulfovibrio sp.]|uniref:PP2C family protein-serine/threonine phosphatase n=1 Tax=Halodesulfovibrio sp. TaxID=1912772 RepID=UPI00359DC544